ncbi:MAG TPA: FkbM family methyltransferase [Solirubrobacterales bacterium]|nr:FkbM family methyltransferase [Solirubrobacterales bacterium]
MAGHSSSPEQWAASRMLPAKTRTRSAREVVEAALCRVGLYRPLRAVYHRALKPGNVESRRRDREFFRAFVPHGGLAFDIGANIGHRTEAFLALGARVVAVEPNPALSRRVERRLRSSRLTVLSAAVGAEPGRAELHLGISHVYSTLSSEWIARVHDAEADERWAGTIMVDVATLDGLIDRYGSPEFVKIDVEGFEVEVLRGLTRAVPAMSFEFQRSALDMTRDCVDMVDRLGTYEYNFTPPERLEFALDEWTDSGTLLERLDAFRQDPVNSYGDVYARRPLRPMAAG